MFCLCLVVTLDQIFETGCLIKVPLPQQCPHRLYVANVCLKSFECAFLLDCILLLICCYYFGSPTSNPATGFIQNIRMCVYCFCFKYR